MKYILLFLVAVMGDSLLSRDVSAQTKMFDSITFQLNDICIDTSIYPKDNFKSRIWSFVCDSEAIVGDSLLMFQKTGGKSGDIIMIYDSVTKTIDSLVFQEVFGDRYGGEHTYMTFSNVSYKEDFISFELIFDSTDLKKSFFSYYQNIHGFAGQGSFYSWTYTYLPIFLASTSVTISFKKHIAVNSVKRNFTNVANLSLFPSPVNSSLNIHLQNPDDNQLIITDLLGRKMLTRQIGDGEEDISVNIASLLKGVYWVRVGSRIQKFIVQH